MIYRKIANWFKKNEPVKAFDIIKLSTEELEDIGVYGQPEDGTVVLHPDENKLYVIYGEEWYEWSSGGGDVSDLRNALNAEIARATGVEGIINSKIPAQASATNQLGDKDFINSSIATHTAHFLGTYDVVDDLGLEYGATNEEIAAALATVIDDPTNNDYSFAIDEDTSSNTLYKRFKYNDDETAWEYEYTLNNSSFTANQWAAINSGITEELVEQIEEIENKLDKDESTSVYPKTYAKNTDGTQGMVIYTPDAFASSLVCRDANNRFRIADPSVAQDAATKNYVDNKINNSHVLTWTDDDDVEHTLNLTTKDTISE